MGLWDNYPTELGKRVEALDEGWAIGTTEPDDNHDAYELVRIDEQERFDGDGAVWEFVAKRASEGSEIHREVIDWFRANTVKEWEYIETHLVYVQSPWLNMED